MKHENPTKVIPRDSIFKTYTANMVAYLKAMHPECNEEDIHKFVVDKANARIRLLKQNYANAVSSGEDLNLPRTKEKQLFPVMDIVRGCKAHDPSHKRSDGNLTYFEHEDPAVIANELASKIVTPSGSSYETTDVIEAFTKGMLDTKAAQRKAEKKLMLQAKKNNDYNSERYHNGQQATIKIGMNSFIGGQGSGFCFLSNIANFNSVTSFARFFVRTAYAHCERLLASNFYFKNVNQVINHLICCEVSGPTDEAIDVILAKYNLYRPTDEEVSTFLCDSLCRYNTHDDMTSIRTMCSRMSSARLAFIYYMSNLVHLFQANESFFRPWLKEFFSSEPVDITNVKAEQIYELDGDLITVLSTVHQDLIPKNKSGNSLSIWDTVESYPDICKTLYVYGIRMTKLLENIQPIIDLFTDHNVGIGWVSEHEFMYRKVVCLSDTDSIIFTTQNWIQWYCGKLTMSPDAFSMNALIVYFLSKATVNVLYHLSVDFGTLGKDCLRMNMKNEFMMPVMLLTDLKKHYASILKIQEGVFFGKPRLDIKGVGLRGSNYSYQTLNFIQWFIQSAIDCICEHGSIPLRRYVMYAIAFEQYIYESLRKGEVTFLTVKPVKPAAEYKDQDKSIYFSYCLWEHAFAATYGHIELPTKCFVVSVDLSSDGVKNMRKTNSHIADLVKSFKQKNNKDEINYIPINPMINEIPKELRAIADFRKIVYANVKAVHLALSSFGLCLGASSEACPLLSDSYDTNYLTLETKHDIETIFEHGKLN